MGITRTFSDIDEHAAQMSGFDQQYVQLSRGSFRGVFSSFALPRGIGFDVEWLAQAVHQQACVPQQTVSLVTFLDVAGRAIFNGHGIDHDATFLLGPGTELNVRTAPGTRIAVISIPLAQLDREVPSTALTLQSHPDGSVARMLDATACATIVRPMLWPLLQALDAEQASASVSVSESIADDLLESVIGLLCASDAADDAPPLGSRRRRRELFLSALDIMSRDDVDGLTVGKLCRLAGASRRTLEYSFDEAVAMSPLQYLKVVRLNAVRRELGGRPSSSVTIGDVAARHGIWHLSRLSKDYARMFGELPSATLRRSRAASLSLSIA